MDKDNDEIMTLPTTVMDLAMMIKITMSGQQRRIWNCYDEDDDDMVRWLIGQRRAARDRDHVDVRKLVPVHIFYISSVFCGRSVDDT